MTERGSASLLVVGLAAVLSILLVLGLDLARLIDLQLQARAAADASALAAAVATFEGPSPGGQAARFAMLNGARLVGCQCPPDHSMRARSVSVLVEKPVEAWVIPVRAVRAEALAEYDPLP